MAEPVAHGTDSAAVDSVDLLRGLSATEAARRLQADGPNELPTARRRALLTLALEVLREPMFLLLIACGVIYLVLGDLREALTLLSFVFVIMGITLVQEHKSERAVEALRDLSSPRALVIRDGVQRRIAGRAVVRGDVLILAEGDRVPADALLRSTAHCAVDESLLTGESAPVRKQLATGPGADPELSRLYSGTLVVQGKALAEVTATGLETQLGRIGRTLATQVPEPTHVQRETARVVTRVALLAGALSVLVAVIYGLNRGDWLHGLLAGLTLAMGILPEELPVVLTLFLGLGAWRIAHHRVLTRRVAALEMLGAVTVLCSDKTGTLTHNRMAVAQLAVDDAVLAVDGPDLHEIPEDFHALLEYSVLASQSDPHDPMEQAIQRSAQELLSRTEHLHTDWRLVAEYPLSNSLLAMTHVWHAPGGAHYVIAAKGAPEAIADLCHLTPEACSRVESQVARLAAQGLRVLGVARALLPTSGLPSQQHDFEFELVGLLGLIDPVREGVPAALREAQEAGIRVVMITGDAPATALHVAQRIGLSTTEGCLTGPEIETLEEASLRQRVRGVNVFCRVSPEHKWRLVAALKADGAVVAMTGDGVNDAPALKVAHVGIAMGGRGTDVAREAAALVLLDDDFSAIVAAIRLGRRIFDNLRKAIAFIVAVHVPIVGLSLVPVALGWPLVLMPVHILFLQLIIDPVCSVVFEAEPDEPDVMRRPPRPPHSRLFQPGALVTAFLQGMTVLAADLLLYALALGHGLAAPAARALAFVMLVTASLGLIHLNRSPRRSAFSMLATRNPVLWLITGGGVIFLALIQLVPWLRDLFAFAPVPPRALLAAVGLALGCVGLLEVAKRLFSR